MKLSPSAVDESCPAATYFARLFIFHTTSRDIERERDGRDLFGAVPLNIKPARLPTVLFCCPYTFAVIPAAQPMRIDPTLFLFSCILNLGSDLCFV
jgi:hypothetical protein